MNITSPRTGRGRVVVAVILFVVFVLLATARFVGWAAGGAALAAVDMAAGIVVVVLVVTDVRRVSDAGRHGKGS